MLLEDSSGRQKWIKKIVDLRQSFKFILQLQVTLTDNTQQTSSTKQQTHKTNLSLLNFNKRTHF